MKMIKKWIACLMAVGMMLSLTACGVSGDQVAVNKPQQKDPDAKKRIAVSMVKPSTIHPPGKRRNLEWVFLSISIRSFLIPCPL